MKWFAITLIIVHVVLMDCTGGQYPDCVTCTDGSMPLSPLSYNTMRSNVFNGIQPSNDSNILTDCDQGFNGGDYSDLSRTFAWNRTTSVAQQVSIVFRFDQQINISRITMFFWNSPNNSIIIPNVRLAWSDHNMQFIDTTITTNSPNRTGDGQSILNIDISNDRLKFLYLRIVMSFYTNSQWIFLGEVQFCGNTAPFHITQPSTDNDVQIVSPTATMTSITCSLNITIPSTMVVTWIRNYIIITSGTQNGDTASLLLGIPQLSDVGNYQCVFSDYNSGWTIRRNVRLVIADITTTTSTMATTSTATSTATFTTTSTTTILTTTTATTTASVTTSIPSVTSTPTPSTTIITTSATDSSTVSSTDTTIATSDTSTSIASVSTSSASSSVTSIAATTTTTTPAVASTAAGTTTTTVISSTTHTTHTTTTTVATTATVVPTTTSTASTTTTTTIADIYTSTVTTATSTIFTSVTTASAVTATATMNTNNPSSTLSASSDDNNSFSVGITVAIVVLVVVVLITITVVVIGIIVIWKKGRHQQHTKSESIYYSTIDETMIKRPPGNEAGPIHARMNDEQDNKEPQYMDISIATHSTKQGDKVTMQDNPAYSAVSSEHQVMLQDNPAYSISYHAKQ